MSKHPSFSKQIHTILMEDWDPIGFDSFEEFYKEFGPYLDRVVDIAASGGDPQEISDYLSMVECDYLGLNVNRDRIDHVAGKVCEILKEN